MSSFLHILSPSASAILLLMWHMENRTNLATWIFPARSDSRSWADHDMKETFYLLTSYVRVYSVKTHRRICSPHPSRSWLRINGNTIEMYTTIDIMSSLPLILGSAASARLLFMWHVAHTQTLASWEPARSNSHAWAGHDTKETSYLVANYVSVPLKRIDVYALLIQFCLGWELTEILSKCTP